jgi:prenyltransferase beta subunit
MNKRDLISSHYSNDRDDLFRFVRDTRLPLGYFRDRRLPTADQCVFWVCIAAAVIAVIWSH